IAAQVVVRKSILGGVVRVGSKLLGPVGWALTAYDVIRSGISAGNSVGQELFGPQTYEQTDPAAGYYARRAAAHVALLAAARVQYHHIFPQGPKFRRFFTRRGINIDLYSV